MLRVASRASSIAIPIAATPRNPYLNLAGLQRLPPYFQVLGRIPFNLWQTRPITDGTQTATVYDPNVRNPYIQSLTMALTRQIGSSLTIDVRYIGTLSRKQIGTINLNANNWLSNGLKDAFDAGARRRGICLVGRVVQGSIRTAPAQHSCAQRFLPQQLPCNRELQCGSQCSGYFKWELSSSIRRTGRAYPQ